MAGNVFKFGPHLKELRIHLCQKSPASKGIREFIESKYVNVKQKNPTFPILIRECSGVQPILYARYEYGVERKFPLANLSVQEVYNTMQNIATTDVNK